MIVDLRSPEGQIRKHIHVRDLKARGIEAEASDNTPKDREKGETSANGDKRRPEGGEQKKTSRLAGYKPVVIADKDSST